jgi:hypothetical protein
MSLPIYLNFSAGVGSKSIAPKTEADSLKPIYFTKSGETSIDLVRKSGFKIPSGRHRFVVDGVAPSTISKFTVASKSTQSNQIFYGKGLKLNLESIDKYSGLEQLYFSLNQTEFIPFENTLSPSVEGENSFKYYAVDKVGNVEKGAEKKFILDLSAPSSSIEKGGTFLENIFAKNGKIGIVSEDKFSGVARQFFATDKGNLRTYSSIISLSNLLDGKHSIQFKAVDKVKNEEELQNYDFEIDRIAPIVKHRIIGKTFVGKQDLFVDGNIKIGIFATDNRVGTEQVFFELDNQPSQVYETPISLQAKDGSHSLNYYAVDKLGNRSKKISQSISFVVDGTAPEIWVEIDGIHSMRNDTLLLREFIEIKAKSKDDGAGVKNVAFQLDSGSFQTGEKLEARNAGSHSVLFRAEDYLGNITDTSFIFYVDNSPPELTLKMSEAPQNNINLNDELFDIYPANTKIFLTSIDSETAAGDIYYTIDKSKKRLYKKSISGFPTEKAVEIEIFAADLLGNMRRKILKLYFVK